MSPILHAFAALAIFATPRQESPTNPTANPTPSRMATSIQSNNDERGAVEVFDVSDLAFPSRIRSIASSIRVPGLSGADPSSVAQNQTFLQKWEDGQAQVPTESVKSKATAYRLLEALARGVATNLDPSATVQSQQGGVLVVRGTRKVRGAVDAMLKSIRAGHDVLPIEMQFLELDQEGRKLVAERTDDVERLPGKVATLSKETLDLLIEKKCCTLLSAPTVSVLPLDMAEMRTTEQLNYVANVQSIAIEGMGTIAEPVVKTLEIGTTVQVRAVAATGLFSKEPTLFALRVEIEDSVLKRPIATQKTDLGVIQLPEVKTATVASTLVASAGARVLLGGVPKPAFDESDEARWLYLLVQVHEPTNVEDAAPPKSEKSPKAEERTPGTNAPKKSEKE